MLLAKRLGGEVISADAVQVYRGCCIGSAKPSAAQRACVPHHLIDVADPTGAFDASRFETLAKGAITDIVSRGLIPILCGGTGLYVRALRLGLIAVPKDAMLRAQLEAADAERPGASMARLLQLDPQSAHAIHPHNAAYVRRALEITLLMGRPASAVWAEHAAQAEAQPITLFWLDCPDALLRERIAARAAAMLDAGFVEEVRGLLDRGVSPSSPALKSVGYKEVVAVLQGQMTHAQLVPTIIKNTWGYVRRQRIWLRREATQDPARVVVLPTGATIEQLAELLIDLWPSG